MNAMVQTLAEVLSVTEPLIGGLALSVAVFIWFLLGWSRDELMCRVKELRKAVAVELELVAAIPRNWWGRISKRLGVGPAKKAATTLGEVSEMIDIIRLGLLAGLSFDASLGLYCEGRRGALADRMSQALLTWRTGLETREEALLQAARDLDVRALETFAMAVGQALELGAPLADTLAGQSREIRAAHRAEVERRIERAPVKLLIPTGTLILPALLLSILGPLLASGGML